MTPTSINFLAIVVAVAVKQGLGLLWYSPMLFGKSFAGAAGVTVEKMSSTLRRSIAADTTGTLLTALALDYAMGRTGAASWFYGLLLGLGCWAAFVVPASARSVLFEGRPRKLFSLETGYLAVSYGVMGAILGGWR
jgi:hypothetical protein